MNFFGLTSLGPRSTLGHSATNAKHQRLQEVTDEQVLKVFDAFDEKHDGTVARKQLRALLDALYNHPPPENEVALFTKYFDTHQSGNPQNKNLKFFAAKNFSNRRLTKAEFQSALTYVRQELNNEQTLSGEYNKSYLPPAAAPANPNAPTVVLTSLPTSSAAPYAYAPEAFAVAQPTQRYAAPVTAASLTKNLFNVEPVRGGKLAAAGAAVVAGTGKGAAAPAAAAGGATAAAAGASDSMSARALAAAVSAPGHASGAAQTAGIGVPRIAVQASAPFATATTAPAAAAGGAANAPAKEQPLTESARYAASHGGPAPPKAAEFKSAAHYRDKMRKHTRLQHDPKEKFRLPVTTSHEYGWFEAIDAERVPVCPKNSCPETVFASQMVKSGIYF